MLQFWNIHITKMNGWRKNFMLIDELTKEFNELLKEKNFNYSNPDVVEKGLELEKEMFKNFQN